MLEILKDLLGIVRGTNPWTFKSLAALISKMSGWIADNLPDAAPGTEPPLMPVTEDVPLETMLQRAVNAFESNEALALPWKMLLQKLLEFALTKFLS